MSEYKPIAPFNRNLEAMVVSIERNHYLTLEARECITFLEAGNEIDGMQRYMATADIAMSPPMDWKDIFVPKPKKVSTEKSAAPN